jgi:hypothetical protein
MLAPSFALPVHSDFLKIARSGTLAPFCRLLFLPLDFEFGFRRKTIFPIRGKVAGVVEDICGEGLRAGLSRHFQQRYS